MSSRFVSGGQINAATGETAPAPPPPSSATTPAPSTTRDTTGPSVQRNPSLPTAPAASATAGASSSPAGFKPNPEWEAVQRELEADRKRREEARRTAVEGGEKSLFDVLQANKAAKEAAFEEANKIKNQFRALDDDEIDFLDDVRARERAAEEKIRLETSEGLRAFREAQNAAGGGEAGDGTLDMAAPAAAPATEGRPAPDPADEWADEWKTGPAGAGGRKRKRHAGDREIKGLVRRKTSTSTAAAAVAAAEEGKKLAENNGGTETVAADAGHTVSAASKPTSKPPGDGTSAPAKPGLALVGYDSDDSD